MKKTLIVSALAVVALAACSKSEPTPAPVVVTPPAVVTPAPAPMTPAPGTTTTTTTTPPMDSTTTAPPPPDAMKSDATKSDAEKAVDAAKSAADAPKK